MAFVIAVHEIEDAVGFGRAIDSSTSLPDGLPLRRVYPLVNGAKAVCLWEGESADSVGDYVDGLLGDIARSEFYEVDRASALGLPPTDDTHRRDFAAKSAEVEGFRNRSGTAPNHTRGPASAPSEMIMRIQASAARPRWAPGRESHTPSAVAGFVCPSCAARGQAERRR
jgi:hypothetical protein